MKRIDFGRYTPAIASIGMNYPGDKGEKPNDHE